MPSRPGPQARKCLGLALAGLVMQLGCLEKPKPIQDPRDHPVAVVPAEATLTAGRTRRFAVAFGEGPVSTVTWGVLEPGGGAVDAEGVYQAPAQAGTFTLQARCLDAAARSAAARITVVAPPRAELTAPPLLLPEAPDQTATVPAVPGATYAWTVTGGLILRGADGPALTFQAGARGRTELTCRVTNPAGETARTSLSIPIAAPVSLAIRPAQVIITQGRSMKFGFELQGGVTLKAVWSLGEPGCGSVDANGQYVAPETPGSYTVRVASVDDPRQVALAQVKVVRKPPEDIFGVASFQPGATGLTARVADVEGMTYAWTVQGGTLTSSAEARSVTFTAGPGDTLVLHCRITNEAGDSFLAVRTLQAQ